MTISRAKVSVAQGEQLDRRISAIALPVLVAAFASVGAFKGLSFIAESPIDLTVVLAGATLLVTILSPVDEVNISGRKRVLIVWSFFFPGLVVSVLLGVPLLKAVMLYTLTLCAAFAGATIRRDQLRYWLWMQVGLACLMGALLIAFPVTTVVGTERLIFAGGTTITAARVMGAGVLVLLVVLLRGLRSFRLILCLFICASLLATMLSVGSRGPFLALVIAALFAFSIGRVRLWRKLVAIALGLLVGILALGSVGVSHGAAASRALSIFSTNVEDDARGELVKLSIEAISQNWLGLGWGGFGALVRPNSPASGQIDHPHNLALEVIVENGWVAGGAALGWIAVVALSATRIREQGPSSVVAPLVIYWLVNAMFSSDINGNRELWVTLGIAASIGLGGVQARRSHRALRRQGARGRQATARAISMGDGSRVQHLSTSLDIHN